MIHNILYLDSKDNNIDLHFSSMSNYFFKINYIKYIDQYGYSSIYEYLKNQIIKNNINIIFISFSDCDSSLDIKKLNMLKKKYNLKYIFIFNDSHNSFEYIDRYYAQLAELVIIPNIPIMNDFYKTLDIPTYIIKSYYKNNIILKNIFSSSLINLVPNNTTIDNTIDFSHDIINIFNILDNNEVYKINNILLDDKFLFTQDLFKIFWIIKRYIYSKNIQDAIQLVNYYKYAYYIVKLYKYIKNNQNDLNVLHILNKLFYKEYQL